MGGSSEGLLGSLAYHYGKLDGRLPSVLPYAAQHGHIKRGSVSRALANDGLASLMVADSGAAAALIEGWWSSGGKGDAHELQVGVEPHARHASSMGRSTSMPKMAMPGPPSLPALR